jgi:hypothetical protein
MGLGVARVELHGLFQERQGLGEGRRRGQVVVGPALQVGIVGLEMLRSVAGLLVLFVARQTDRKRRDDLLRNQRQPERKPRRGRALF